MTGDSNSTPVSEIQKLSGSTPPGAGRPTFRSAAPTRPIPRPRPQIRPRLEGDASDQRQIVDLVGRALKLLKRRAALTRRIDILVLHELCADRLQSLRSVRRRTLNRLVRHIQTLARTKASTTIAVAAKGDLYVEMRVAGWVMEHHLDTLGLSLAHDAIALGIAAAGQRDEHGLATGHACSIEEAAEIHFEPWTIACPVPPNSAWSNLGAIHLPFARIAWLVNIKSKNQLIETLAEMHDDNDGQIEKLHDDIRDTCAFFEMLHDLMEAADLRIMIALSTMMGDPRHQHRFTSKTSTPATAVA